MMLLVDVLVFNSSKRVHLPKIQVNLQSEYLMAKQKIPCKSFVGCLKSDFACSAWGWSTPQQLYDVRDKELAAVWKWDPCCTDGMVLGPIAFQERQGFKMQVKVIASEGLQVAQVVR
jgi:hypothetical protein